jgi:hypothetical protein
MFMQVIQGKVGDPAEVKSAVDRWTSELAPGATGWLGTTCGVTADGMSVAIVRFQDEEAARANSDRPEQNQWWMEMSKLFSGDVTFHDCRESSEFLHGGSDEARFVQVIQGRTDDEGRLRELNAQIEQYAGTRPDLIGGTIGMHGDGGFTQVAYFTSEEEARAAEGREPPEEMKAVIEEEMALIKDVAYFDLTDPWLYAPR